MILKPKDSTYLLPAADNTADIFAHIAAYNEADFYETDNTGVTPNEIKQSLFFIDRIETAVPRQNDRTRFNGFLFVGIPSDFGTDVDNLQGQFENIIKELLSKGFIDALYNYVACDYQFEINSLRPLYNTIKYTKATNCTGVEINYSIWL